jgi:hypothetical protein
MISFQFSEALAFADGVTVPVAHFIGFEVLNLIEMPVRIRTLTTGWPRAVIAVLRMEVIVYVAAETFRTMKPRTRADEDAAGKPLGAVVAVGSAVVGSDVIVTVGTYRRDSDLDGHLTL